MLHELFRRHQAREMARHGDKSDRYHSRSDVVGGPQHCGSAHVKVEDKLGVIVARSRISRPGLVVFQIEKAVDDDRSVVGLEAAVPISG